MARMEEQKAENAVERACRLAAITQAELARRCQVSPQAVDKWGHDRVPDNRVKQIVAVINGVVTPHDLRPDLYPAGFEFPQTMLDDARETAA